MKKFLKIVAILLILIIGLLIAIPYFFKDEIISKIKSEINKQTEATIDFDDVDLSFFKSFPNFSISLEDFSVITPMDSETKPLTKANEITLVANIKSIIDQNTPIEIQRIILDEPFINVLVDHKGIANYEVLTAGEVNSAQSNNDFLLKLDKYQVKNGELNFIDQSQGLNLHIGDIDHLGSGQLSSADYILNTSTSLSDLDLTYTKIPYLKNAKLTGDINFNIDNDQQKYSFNKAELLLNNLGVYLTGDLQAMDEAYKMKVDFESNTNKFKDFLSLIPGAYTSDFKNVDADGSLKFNGNVDGLFYAEKEIYPKFNIVLNAKDAYFKYPDLPEKVENINLDILINNQTDNIKNTLVNINSFAFDIRDNPFKGNMRLSKLLGNTAFDGSMNGVIDFGLLAKAYPMEGVNMIKGVSKLNVKTRGQKDDLLNNKGKNLFLEGDFSLNNFEMQSQDYPKMNIVNLDAQLNQNEMQFNMAHANFGKSDVNVNGKIANPLALILEEAPINGNLNFKSKLLDLNEWYDPNQAAAETATTINPDSYDKTNLNVSADIDRLLFDDYDYTDIHAEARINGDKMLLTKSSLKNKSTDVSATGELSNIWGYGLNDETLSGKIKARSNNFNLNDFMTEVEDPGDEVAAGMVVLIPPQLDIDMDVKADKVLYEKVTLKNVSSKVYLKDEEAGIQNMVAEGLGGKMRMDGSYNTQDHTAPKFSLKYDMSRLSFGELTESFESAAIIAPIARFIEGLFNSTLMLSGNLTPDLFPDFNTLTGQGFLESFDSKIKGYQPLNKVNELFNFRAAKDWSLKNSKNWFVIKDGAVEIQEFDYAYQGIDFKIGGSHKINQDMNYLFKAKVPRELLQKNKVGQLANEGIDKLIGSINKAGIPLNNSEFIDINIYLTGNIKSPKIKIEPVGVSGKSVKDAAKQAVNEQINKAKDSINTRIQEEKEKVVTKAEEKVEQVKDTIVNKVEEEVVAQTDKIKEQIKDKISNKVDSTIGAGVKDTIVSAVEDKLGGILGDKTKVNTDSIKSKLDKFNPFKKKKKGN